MVTEVPTGTHNHERQRVVLGWAGNRGLTGLFICPGVVVTVIVICSGGQAVARAWLNLAAERGCYF